MNFIALLIILLIAPLEADPDPELKIERLSAEREAWLERDLNKALESLLAVEESTSDALITSYNLGYLYYLTGNNAKALQYLKSTHEQDPSYPYSYLTTARIYEESGNLFGAISQLKRALNYDADNYDILLEIAKIQSALGQLGEAEKIYLQIIKKYEDKIPPRVGLASIYRKQKKYEEAQNLLAENPLIYPESSFLFEKARLYNDMGDQALAVKYISQLINDYPNTPEIQAYRDTLKIRYGIEEFVGPGPITGYKYQIVPKETLDYKVKYGFITLGWLNVQMGEKTELDGRPVYPIVFHVNSNPAFNFLISLHHIYESYIDAETMNAMRTRLYTPGSEFYLARLYYFEYDKSLFTSHAIMPDGRYVRVVKNLPRMAQDGTSMLYFARGIVSNQVSGTTTVVIDEEYKYGHINYLNETEEVDIGDNEIDALKIFARADFQGVAGMNGDAWGWFSPDEQCVPLMGKVKIILGSITIKMED